MKEKAMVIYNSVLLDDRILFIGHDKSIQESIGYVLGAAQMVQPINVYDRLFPYEHLLNLDFINFSSFIASVSNPLLASNKQWFDICYEIHTG